MDASVELHHSLEVLCKPNGKGSQVSDWDLPERDILCVDDDRNLLD